MIDESNAESLSDTALDRMISTTPRLFRRELIDAITRLEVLLNVLGVDPSRSWNRLLVDYRASQAIEPGSAQRAGRMGSLAAANPLIIEYVKEIDRVFRSIREFNPDDVLTEAVKARVFSPIQAERSQHAIAARKEKHEVAHRRRKEVVQFAVKKLSKTKGFDLNTATTKCIFDECYEQWERFHVGLGINKDSVKPCPSINTMLVPTQN